MRPRTIRLIAAAFLLSIATVPMADANAGDATPQQIAKAREAFREGVSLEAANDWSGALAKFESVAAVKMTPQVRFHIARCQHKMGKLLEALGGYRMAAHEASQSKDPKAPEVLREASEGLAEVEKKIPKLIIIRGKGTEAGGISLDGVALGESSIGKEVPVNPGGHTIEFRDPDGKSNRVVITLGEGETRKIDLIQEAAKPPPPPPTQSAAPTQSAPPPPPPPPSPSVLPWVFVGVGGASLVASGVFYLMRNKAISDLDAQCIDTRCPASMQDTGDKGKMYTTLGNVTLGLGVVGIGVGTVLLLTGNKSSNADAPAKKESTSKTRMTVVFGGSSNSGEARLVGTF
ncbi:MAG: hypothetical protein HY898_13000 [Deltaproteobacteria bacterium]|nr:hypothetical protein [Deltaproteobacteria bacterium]